MNRVAKRRCRQLTRSLLSPTSSAYSQHDIEKLKPHPPKPFARMQPALRFAEAKSLTTKSTHKKDKRIAGRFDYNPVINPKVDNRDISAGQLVRFLGPYMWPKDPQVKRWAYRAIGLLFATKCLGVTLPFMLKEAVNAISVAEHANYMYAAGFLGLFGVTRTLVSATNEMRATLLGKVVQNCTKSVAEDTFKHLSKLDMGFYLEGTTKTISAVRRSTKAVETFLRYGLSFLIPTFVEYGIGLGMLGFYCGPSYILAVVGTVALYSKFSIAYSHTRKPLVRRVRRASQSIDSTMQESFIHYDTMKHFNAEPKELKRFDKLLDDYKHASYDTQRTLNTLNFGQNAIFSAGLTLNLLMAIRDISLGVMTVGDLVLIQTLFLQLAVPMNWLGQMYREMSESQVEISTLYKIFQVKSKVIEKPDAEEFEYKGGEIEFQNVQFGYTPERDVIKDVSFTLQPGSSNAIVGSSGFGKTTLFSLMFRFYDPQSGSIKIDGQDLRDLKLDSLRSNISIVPQTTILFNDSISYNIGYALPNATEEEIVEVAKAANLHERVMQFPDGYDTIVGEHGFKLSGGERQRLALARCLLKDSPIIILDEPTSAMDSQNETQVLDRVQDMTKNKTVIYSAHRLSTIIHVDQIIVVDKGQVVETGSHEELLMTPGSRYSSMWNEFLKKSRDDQTSIEVLLDEAEGSSSSSSSSSSDSNQRQF